MLQGSTGRRPESPGFAQPEDVALLLHTSSTTGSPKRVPRNHRSVCAAARFAAAHFALGPADRCLNVASMVHSQGVNSIIIALVAGGSVVCTRGYDPARFAAWSEECRPTWTATVPTVLRTLLDQIREEPGRLGGRLRFVRSSAAPAPTALLAEAEAAFGVPVVSSYGMTEAPQIASPPLPPDPRKPGSVGPALGADIRIQGDAGEVLPPGEAGEVVARGRTVFDGYDGDPEATAAAFTVDGWFRTGDLGYLDEDGYLFITGRLGDIINRGGVKISPLEVEQVLLAHEGIEQAVAFPVPDERLGEAVAAAVVARGGHPVDERALRRFAADRLAPTKVPRNVVFVEALPTKTNGKVRRRGLAALLGIEAASSANMPGAARTGLVRRGPEGPIEVLVADAWRTVLGLEDVDAEEEFLVLGGDSIQAARIVARLRVCLGLDLSLATFFEAPTVAAMATVIDDLLPQHMVGPGVGSKVPAEELAVRSRGVGDEVSGGE
jgi:acyl-CoA synthetase (AMP-forming)/AMP-acid ligase II/aryl carrier-like protein